VKPTDQARLYWKGKGAPRATGAGIAGDLDRPAAVSPEAWGWLIVLRAMK
jgi:hypothetical protein